MPADPETVLAIQQMSVELRSSIDQRLDQHKAEADAARGRIYERIEEHTRESRKQLSEASAEFRGSIQVVAVQVGVMSAELRAHTAHDDERFQRLERGGEKASSERGRLWTLLAWLLGILGIGTLGAETIDKLKGD